MNVNELNNFIFSVEPLVRNLIEVCRVISGVNRRTLPSNYLFILSQLNPIHTLPPVSLRPILILSYLRLSPQSNLFLSSLATKTLYTFLMFSVHATCPAHLTLLICTQHNAIIKIGDNEGTELFACSSSYV
jgi:hypothetical protein